MKADTVLVHQIYYDAATRAKLLPGFIPLDNTANERPDWFEFWVMLNFLQSNVLDDDAWYGFLSPRFREKTGFTSQFVIEGLQRYGRSFDVAIFSPGWDQLAYFLNPWEQGEAWHPGLTDLAQAFLSGAGRSADLKSLVTDSATSAFCNFIVARKPYWLQWLQLAREFFDFVELGQDRNALSSAQTGAGTKGLRLPMKTFIQERLSSLILATGAFKVLAPDQSLGGPVSAQLFPGGPATRRMLQACDLMKGKYRQTGDHAYLDMYWKIRRDIPYAGPGA